MTSRTLLVLLVGLASPKASAQGWFDVIPRQTPEARSGVELAYDQQRDEVLCFGGAVWTQFPNHVRGDTWVRSGADWRLAAPAVSPSPRFGYSMVYDATRQRIVLFGGADASGNSLADTWEWDGVTWLQVVTPNAPSGRSVATLAFDLTNSRCLLFGGSAGAALLNDTWSYDGTDWTLLATPTSPSARNKAAMAFDYTRGLAVLFGGTSVTQYLSDTWLFDGADWTQHPLAGPPARKYGQLEFSLALGKVVLAGGDSAGAVYSDTWSFDGLTWLQESPPNPSPDRANAGMVYVNSRQSMVLFGGYDSNGVASESTWEFGASLPGDYQAFGVGCSGSLGVPTLAAAPGSIPRAGGIFTAHVDNTPGLTFVVTGFSETFWGSQALPFDLIGYGAPGCALQVELYLAYPINADPATGRAVWSAPILASPDVVGWRFYQQAFTVDPNAGNGLGSAVSNPAVGVIGS